MDIRQIIYQSRATRDMSDEDLAGLLDQSRRLNNIHEVTGLLLYIEHHFMQCIEGPPKAIGQLYENIKADERNEAHFLMLDRDESQRAFPGWSMGYHATSRSGLEDDSCFQNIIRAQDLDSITHRDDSVFKLMRNFYGQNAGNAFS